MDQLKEYHEFEIESITDREMRELKSLAVQKFVESQKACNVSATIEAFMAYFKQKNFKIIKD